MTKITKAAHVHEVFAGVCDKGYGSTTLHETLREASEAAIDAAGTDYKDRLWLGGKNEVVVGPHACLDFDCTSGKIEDLLVEDVRLAGDLSELEYILEKWLAALKKLPESD